MMEITVDPRKQLDILAVGSWTNFDHLFRVSRIPLAGDTVLIKSPIEQVEETFWGGCAPNNATASAKLGAQVGLIGVVGGDFVSRGYDEYLRSLGVDLSGLIIVPDAYCGHSFLFSDPQGDAICISHLGIAEQQEKYEPNASLLEDAKVVIVNYRFDRFTYLAAKIANQAGALTIASGNLSTSPDYANSIIGCADLVVCTEFELGQLIGYLGLSDKGEIFSKGVKAIIETHGVEGSEILMPQGQVHIPAVRSKKVVDPVGAGDGFVGGLATGLAFRFSLEDAVRLGAVVASFVVEALGCQTSQPSYEQALERLHSHFDILK